MVNEKRSALIFRWILVRRKKTKFFFFQDTEVEKKDIPKIIAKKVEAHLCIHSEAFSLVCTSTNYRSELHSEIPMCESSLPIHDRHPFSSRLIGPRSETETVPSFLIWEKRNITCDSRHFEPFNFFSPFERFYCLSATRVTVGKLIFYDRNFQV